MRFNKETFGKLAKLTPIHASNLYASYFPEAQDYETGSIQRANLVRRAFDTGSKLELHKFLPVTHPQYDDLIDETQKTNNRSTNIFLRMLAKAHGDKPETLNHLNKLITTNPYSDTFSELAYYHGDNPVTHDTFKRLIDKHRDYYEAGFHSGVHEPDALKELASMHGWNPNTAPIFDYLAEKLPKHTAFDHLATIHRRRHGQAHLPGLFNKLRQTNPLHPALQRL